MILGYARVSTDDQSTALQRQALEQAGCARIFEDAGVSGVAKKRPGLDAALTAIGPGDVFTVWKLDRLGRSLSDLINIVQTIGQRGAQFRSLTESIDTTTAAGRYLFHSMGAMAEFERALISERTRAGAAAAKKHGQRLGRRHSLTLHQVQHARALVEGGEQVRHVAKTLGVSRVTLYREFKRQDERRSA
jgi:DNA invertase Pin-like site-specific DNA recombinase